LFFVVFVASRVLGVCLNGVISSKGERYTWRIRRDELIDGKSNEEPKDFLPCRLPGVELSDAFSIHIQEDTPRE
jgi:hypothetical protein